MWYCCSQYAVAGAPRGPPPMCTASGLIGAAGGLPRADIAADASAVAPVRALASASEPAAAATGRDRRIGLQDAERGTAPQAHVHPPRWPGATADQDWRG